MTRRPTEVGSAVAIEELSANPHPLLRRLRASEPVSWVPVLDGWLVTSHRSCVEVMTDADTYTVDDDRFSTQQVIGPSMLSLDGSEHRRHRDPFVAPFRSRQVGELEAFTRSLARSLVTGVADAGSADLRSCLAGPLAVQVMARVLDLEDVDVAGVLSWYEEIVEAVDVVTAGGELPAAGKAAFEDLAEAVMRNRDTSGLLETVQTQGDLSPDQIASNVAVLLFGGIVTTENAIAIALRHLLDDPALLADIDGDRSRLGAFVEESLRLEPAAAVVDRYATRDVSLGDAGIRRGDLVRVSLSAANRDPQVFDDPDVLRPDRDGLGRSLTFARGPHACLGLHLARLETVTAIEAVLGLLSEVRPAPGDPDDVTGLVFRAPRTVAATWRGRRPSSTTM